MTDLILRFGVALAIGLLVGLERGWRDREGPAGSRTAGIRTFGISGLLGGILAALSGTMGGALVFAAGFLGYAIVFGWFQAREAARDNSFSVTATVTSLSVFALGGLAVAGDYRAAAAGGAALAGVLASREILHQLLKKLTWVELRSALVLVAMTTIILPLLPDKTIDPWGGFNPREIWLFTVLTATISYLGYIAVRTLGEARGFLVSGMAGALISSTAVTVALARTAKTGNGSSLPMAGAAALAAMVSVLRVTVIILLLEIRAFPVIAAPALAAAATLALCAYFMLSRKDEQGASIGAMHNPFELLPLLIFAAAFAAVSTISAAMTGTFGEGSLVGSSFVSGIFDVDVAVLSALRLADQGIPVQAIGDAVMAGLAANAVGRLSLGIAAGPRSFWVPLAGATVLAAAVAAGVFVVVR